MEVEVLLRRHMSLETLVDLTINCLKRDGITEDNVNEKMSEEQRMKFISRINEFLNSSPLENKKREFRESRIKELLADCEIYKAILDTMLIECVETY